MVAIMAQLTADLRIDQKSKRMEESMSNMRYRSMLFIHGSSGQENSNFVRGKNNEGTKLLKINFPHFGRGES